MALKIKDGETILFIGDSITDCGRTGAQAPLGSGYVKLFADLVTVREPGKKLTIINKGIGGNKVTDLRARWSDDVLRNKPDWLSVKVGINDFFFARENPQGSVATARFEESYDVILSRTRETLPDCRMLLIDPFYLSRDESPSSIRSAVLKELPDFIGVVHRMSRRFGTRLVKTHEMFQRLLESHESDEFCLEPVHPNLTGHLAIAEAVYAALSR